MKISQITYPGFGGLGSVVFSLIAARTEDREIDWEIGFIGDLALDPTLAQRCEDFEIPHAYFQTKAGKPYLAWVRLARWLRQRKPDAVICHSINSILACKWFGIWRQVPVIAVEHTPNQVKTRSERMSSLVSMLVADRVVLLTDEYRSELEAMHGCLYRPHKVVVIPNGIDTSTFHPAGQKLQEMKPPLKTIRLGMAARFSFSKSQGILVDTVDQISELYPNLKIELSLAGAGDHLPLVKAAAKGSDAITFPGLLSEDEVAQWMRGLDIYVHSTIGETLSTSLLQAMATGLPIVASDIPGVSNLLQHGEFGQCVDNDPAAFASAISAMIDRPQSSQDMGQRARQRVEAYYSTTAMLGAYLETLSNVPK